MTRQEVYVWGGWGGGAARNLVRSGRTRSIPGCRRRRVGRDVGDVLEA